MRAYGPDWSVGWVFDRQIGLIRGGTRPTAPVYDGKCGANALRATIVGNWREPSGESRFILTQVWAIRIDLGQAASKAAGSCSAGGGRGSLTPQGQEVHLGSVDIGEMRPEYDHERCE